MDLDEILLTAQDAMQKALDYARNELRGLRTGRASTALVEYVKVDYYGAMTDLRSLALINVPEPTQLLIKPFDASSIQACAKALQSAGLGLNPIVDGKQIRVSLPALTGERRKQLAGSAKQMGEQAKIAVRNARRDANKHVDQTVKDKALHISEDEVETTKEEIQDLLKKYEQQISALIEQKVKEIQEI